MNEKIKVKLYNHIFEFKPNLEGFSLLSLEALAATYNVHDFFDAMKRFNITLGDEHNYIIVDGEPVPGRWEEYIFDLLKEDKNNEY